jgi:hypothetical protein
MNLRAIHKSLVLFLLAVSMLAGCTKKVTNEQVHSARSEPVDPVHSPPITNGTPPFVTESEPTKVASDYDPFEKQSNENADSLKSDVTSPPEITNESSVIGSSQEPDYPSEDQRISEQIKEIDRQISDLNNRMADEPIDYAQANTQWECFKCGRTFWFYSVQPHTHRTGPCPSDIENGMHAWMPKR